MPDLKQQWICAMRDGRFDAAWAISEQTLAERDPRTRNDRTLPYHLRWVWDGRPFHGENVLVRCYHGLGDTIQFARYLQPLRKRAASVTVEIPSRLACLLRHAPGIDQLIAFDPAHPLPESKCDIEIMELAFALREPPTSIQPPYLHSMPAPLPSGSIGLCFEAGEWDTERCIPPGLLVSLCASRPCVTLVSRPTDLPVLNPHGCPYDLEVTAALVAGVELVITVDTMIAHLAGAMNKPTWLLLKCNPDWRWSPTAGRSGWYPSVQIYAQPSAGDWASVIAQVERDLETAVHAQRQHRANG